MLRKRIGLGLVVLGCACIISAVALYGHNQHEDVSAGNASSALLTEALAVVSESPVVEVPTEDGAAMPVADVAGYPCVGVIDIPSLGLSLPVLDEWDYQRLLIAPCRQCGTAEERNLVIAGHNYDSHFGSLKDLSMDAEVVFTDMAGVVWCYRVARLDTVAATAVEEAQNPTNDLTLYTCTYGGASRVLVGCDLVS